MQNKNTNNRSDKNWDIFASKISSYKTDEYTSKEWDTMEEMYFPITPTASKFSLNKMLIVFGLILFIGLGFFINRNYYSKKFSESAKSEMILDTEQEQVIGYTRTNNLTKNATVNKFAGRIKPNTHSNNTINDKEIKSNKFLKTSFGTTEIIPEKETNKTILTEQKLKQSPRKTLGGLKKKDVDTNVKLQRNLVINNNKTTPSLDNTVWKSTSKSGKSYQFDELPFSTTLNFDFTNTIPYSSLIQIKEREFDKRLRFGFLLGLNNTITDYSNLTTSHLPFIGLFINKGIANRWKIELGAQIKLVYKYDLEPFYVRRTELFNQNEQVGFFETSLFIDGYLAFELPLTLKYSLTNKLDVSFGLRYNYITPLFNSDNQTRIPSIWTSMEESLLHKTEQKILSHDIGLVIGAEYSLSYRWRVNITWNQGFRDLTPNTLFMDDRRTHLNSDLQISLKYTFRKK